MTAARCNRQQLERIAALVDRAALARLPGGGNAAPARQESFA
jgi:hypothetical protein